VLLADPVTCSHDGAFEVTLHGPQPAAVRTPVEPVPPLPGTVAEVDCKLYAHTGPDWFTVMFWPTMVSVALRAAPLPFGAATKLKLPDPLPLLLPSVIQGVLFVDAVHAQPGPVAMSTLPEPPPDGCTGLLALRLKLHGTPACSTWKV